MALDVPRFPKGTSTARTCRLLIESLPRGAPSRWRIRPRDGRVPAADALVALPGTCRKSCCTARFFGQNGSTYKYASPFLPGLAPLATFLNPLVRERQIRRCRRLVKGRRFCRTRAPSVAVGPSPPAFAGRGRTPSTDVCNLYDPRARPGSPEPHFRAPGLPRDAPPWVAGPLSGPDQSSFLESGARYGFRRTAHPSLRLLAPRLVTPTLVARTPFVVSGWPKRLEEPPCQVHETRTRYEPTRRACLRETRRRRSHFRETFRQGRLP